MNYYYVHSNTTSFIVNFIMINFWVIWASESDGDYEEYDDEDDIEEEIKESGCDRVLRLLQGI